MHGSRGWNQRWLIYATQAGTRKHQVRLKSVKTVPRSKWHQSQVDCLNLRSTGKGLIAEVLPNFPQPRSWICAMNHTCQESRSEERRVGKECRSGWCAEH